MSGVKKYTDAQFKAAYDISGSTMEMKVKMGCSMGSVYNYLKRTGRSFKPLSAESKDAEALELFRQYKWWVTIQELSQRFHHSKMNVRSQLQRAIEIVWNGADEEFSAYRKLPIPRDLYYIKIYHVIVTTPPKLTMMTVAEMAEHCNMSAVRVKGVLFYIRAPRAAMANPAWREQQEKYEWGERVRISRERIQEKDEEDQNVRLHRIQQAIERVKKKTIKPIKKIGRRGKI